MGLAKQTLAAAALLALLPALPALSQSGPVDRFPRAGSAYLVAVDGVEVFARAPDEPRPPASLTKLMTALLALEAGEPAGALVRVSPRAARETGSRAGLKAGEELGVGDLLAATLVGSANDACLALSEHLAGTVPLFVARMNARALELGLLATHFVNPCGHDAPGHLASARDLLRLTRAALGYPEFRRLVALERTTLVTRQGRTIELRTHNLLLGRFKGAVGVKSGYTALAGPCVVALARQDGVEALVVLLDAPDRWWTAAALLEAAFESRRPHG